MAECPEAEYKKCLKKKALKNNSSSPLHFLPLPLYISHLNLGILYTIYVTANLIIHSHAHLWLLLMTYLPFPHPGLVRISSVQFSCSVMSNSLRPHESHHARPPCPLPTPRVYPNRCPLSW